MQSPQSATELLQALIRIPSVNPSGTPGTSGVGEKQCATFTAAFLEMLGAQVELREVLPERPNVVAKFPSNRAGKPRVLFAPHTDTVSVAGMTIDPFGGEVRDGRIWGRGASDTKGSMAAMLWAFREMRERLPALSHEIWFAGLVGEEAGQHGAKALAQQEHFDFVIAGEPTSLQIVHTHKGSTNLRLTTRGKAAHAAQPHLGDNAIGKMAAVIDLIQRELVTEMTSFTHPVLGTSTISVGTIAGGSKTNIVPDSCEATVDLRTVPAQNSPDFFDHLSAQLRSVCPELGIEMRHSAPLHTDPAHPLIAVLERLGARCVGAPWFCDAAIFAAQGTPAIALGPGSIDQAHTENEWITVENLENGADFFTKFLAAL